METLHFNSPLLQMVDNIRVKVKTGKIYISKHALYSQRSIFFLKSFPKFNLSYFGPDLGKENEKVEPAPCVLSTQIFPLFFVINSLQRINPNPVPFSL